MGIRITIVLCAALSIVVPRAAARPVQDEPASVVLESRDGGDRPCLACDSPVGPEGRVGEYRGRRVILHASACEEHWRADAAALFGKLEARGALTDENSVVGGRLGSPWSLLGIFVVAALGLLAVRATAMRRPSATAAPVHCGSCGASLHPCAPECPACGEARRPSSSSEAELARTPSCAPRS